ncbi:hypothetical protein [Caldalkalibacillus salinus]|uniref:hypothetical protein n=1 Tax=Caldalkalibacillus salinus TaxID=2803787 RepID=UPI001921E6B2|nr:hypothetical protein [Caldalkalibacillus salinus]
MTRKIVGIMILLITTLGCTDESQYENTEGIVQEAVVADITILEKGHDKTEYWVFISTPVRDKKQKLYVKKESLWLSLDVEETYTGHFDLFANKKNQLYKVTPYN